MRSSPASRPSHERRRGLKAIDNVRGVACDLDGWNVQRQPDQRPRAPHQRLGQHLADQPDPWRRATVARRSRAWPRRAEQQRAHVRAGDHDDEAGDKKTAATSSVLSAVPAGTPVKRSAEGQSRGPRLRLFEASGEFTVRRPTPGPPPGASRATVRSGGVAAHQSPPDGTMPLARPAVARPCAALVARVHAGERRRRTPTIKRLVHHANRPANRPGDPPNCAIQIEWPIRRRARWTGPDRR